MMNVRVVSFFVFFPILCFGADRFVLQSELRTNYIEGLSTKTFTGYTYDDDGNRILKRVYDGVDSAASLMSREIFAYDASGRVIRDLLTSATGDTLSIVNNTYGDDGLVCASTLNKDGSMRFKDSLIYGGGNLIEQRRYNASSTMTFFHRYGYTSGLLAADSLFERNATDGYEATRALAVSHNADSTVSQEVQWRKSGSSWYAVGTTKMVYQQKRLISASSYETDGSSGRLLDSLAYAYDANGNRIAETDFDDARTKVYDIVFTWFDTQQVTVSAVNNERMTKRRVVFRSGALHFDAPFTGTVTVYTASGAIAGRATVNNQVTSALLIRTAFGRYVARIDGTTQQSILFSINN